MTDVPFLPPITPWIMPSEPFDQVIGSYGVRLSWMKSHECPCVYSGPMPGSPDSACLQCQGRGVYWDAPSAPFMALIVYGGQLPMPSEPGEQVDPAYGRIQHTEPSLTIPFAAGTVWQQVSLYDAFVELDVTQRFNANLQVGGVVAVPYQQGLAIAASGAVTIYDPVSHEVSSVSGYVVSGATVTLPSSYASGTAYNVEFDCSPVYIAFKRAGGLAHMRPFGGAAAVMLPKRFRLQALDLWTRARQYPGSTSPQTVL